MGRLSTVEALLPRPQAGHLVSRRIAEVADRAEQAPARGASDRARLPGVDGQGLGRREAGAAIGSDRGDPPVSARSGAEGIGRRHPGSDLALTGPKHPRQGLCPQ